MKALKTVDKIDDAIDDTIPDAPDDIKVTVELPRAGRMIPRRISIAHYMKDTSLVQVIASWAPSEVKDTKALAEYELEQTSEYFEDATFSDVESYRCQNGRLKHIPRHSNNQIHESGTVVYLFREGRKVLQDYGAYFSDDEQGKADVESIIASMKIE